LSTGLVLCLVLCRLRACSNYVFSVTIVAFCFLNFNKKKATNEKKLFTCALQRKNLTGALAMLHKTSQHTAETALLCIHPLSAPNTN